MSLSTSTVSDPPPSYTTQPPADVNTSSSSDPASNTTTTNANDDSKSVKSVSTAKVERRTSRRDKRLSTASTSPSHRKEDLKLDTESINAVEKRPHKRHSTSSSRKEEDGKRSPDEVVASEQVRRSTYGPEFLKQLAEQGLSDETKDATGGKFKVVTGSEAMSIYENYVGAQEKNENKSPKDGYKHSSHKLTTTTTTTQQQPIVFAFTAFDGARKVVDYYMTWRGKTRTRHLKGPERKASFLDAEFKRVSKALDKEYKRLSILSEAASEAISIPQPSQLSPAQSILPPPTPQTQPEGIDAPTTDATSPAKTVPPPINPPKPSDVVDSARLSASSVVSLPLLNMIRGVPLGNRLPLFVTNPDPESSSTTSSVRGSIVEAGGSGKDLAEAVADALQRPTTPESSSPNDRYKPKKSSPLAVSSSPSEASSEDSSRSEKSDKSHKREHKSSSNSPTSKSEKDDKSSEILIVLLDEKSDHTWHGLERKLTRKNTKSSVRPASGVRKSPWLGPLVAADKVTYQHRRIKPLRKSSSPFPTDSSSSQSLSSDEDDDGFDDDDYQSGPPAYPVYPVVPAFPIKSYLINEGLLPPEQVQEKPVTSALLTRSASGGSVAPSVYSYNSPYVGSVDMPLGSVASLAPSLASLNGYSRGPTPSPYPPAAGYAHAPYPAAPSMGVMSPPIQPGQIPGFVPTGSPVQAPGYMPSVPISVAGSPYVRTNSVYEYLPGGFVPYH